MTRRAGFVLEYSLGHTTHAQNLKRYLHSSGSVEPGYIDLPFHGTPGWWAGLPGVRSNWSARASLGAYVALRRRGARFESLLFHTQVTSLFSAGLMRRVPSVISLDATPVQYDSLGAFYGHSPSGNGRVEAVKKRLNVRAFTAARHLVTWSQWTKDSLVADYGVSCQKVTVIPPGIDVQAWPCPEDRIDRVGPVRLLFVGADFERKGGRALEAAFRQLPPRSAVLSIVTQSADIGDCGPGVTVYRDLKPNSAALRGLYRQSDIFVFPTRADCLPLAVMEAMASGLPVITTKVGALAEAVTHGETGYIVPPDDLSALVEALTRLIGDDALRKRMSAAARHEALERFNADTNYGNLVAAVVSAAQ